MDGIKKWLRRVSIPAAFIICASSCLLAAVLLTRATVWFSKQNRSKIEAEYAYPLEANVAVIGRDDSVSFFGITEDAVLEEQSGYSEADVFVTENAAEHAEVEVISVESGQLLRQMVLLPEETKKEYDFFVNLDAVAAVLWYSVCLGLGALVFYLRKIRGPFHALNRAVAQISAGDLDFRVEYEGLDEFGRLCQAFETMRQELEKNNRKMWNAMEERRRLNSAFAHDLRTPLTVMRGYTELLQDIMAGKADSGGEMKIPIQAISAQVARLSNFADTMSSLQRLEDYEPSRRYRSASALTEMTSQMAAALFPRGQAEVRSALAEQDYLLDDEALAQICENVLANAARYAREKVVISLAQEEEYLVITVEDDGAGFTAKDLSNATLAYYRGGKSQIGDLSHFGLGLYISSILAEKLGGCLSLANRAEGGAKVEIKIRCV